MSRRGRSPSHPSWQACTSSAHSTCRHSRSLGKGLSRHTRQPPATPVERSGRWFPTPPDPRLPCCGAHGRLLHRFVGYLEETAVHTYTNIVEMTNTPGTQLHEAWKDTPAPQVKCRSRPSSIARLPPPLRSSGLLCPYPYPPVAYLSTVTTRCEFRRRLTTGSYRQTPSGSTASSGCSPTRATIAM